jgi:hypothetical protein
MFSKYKEFRRERAFKRWVVRMATDRCDAIVAKNDGAHVLESNYNRKNRRYK